VLALLGLLGFSGGIAALGDVGAVGLMQRPDPVEIEPRYLVGVFAIGAGLALAVALAAVVVAPEQGGWPFRPCSLTVFCVDGICRIPSENTVKPPTIPRMTANKANKCRKPKLGRKR
jgi:hypothetical protein